VRAGIGHASVNAHLIGTVAAVLLALRALSSARYLSGPPAELQRSCARQSLVGRKLEQASQRLSEIRPPEDAVAANRDLAVAEEQFAEALRGAGDALEGAPISEVPQILQREMEDAPAAKRLDRAIEELNALGY